MTNRTFLHIGMCKTGTTACEHLFHSQKSELFQAGLLYPSTGLYEFHHLSLFDALATSREMEQSTREELLSGLRAEISAAGRSALLSSEHFSFATDEEVQLIAEYFGSDTTVIVVLRQQVYWVSAMYAEIARWGHRSSFRDFVHDSFYNSDYNLLLRRWERCFGRKNIEVVSYDRHESDLAAEILRRTGLSQSVIARIGPAERLHMTLPAPLVHLQWQLSEGQPNGLALEPSLRSMEDDAVRSATPLAKAWRIPEELDGKFRSLDEANDKIARDYDIPTPLFGRTIADLLAENRTQGYGADAVSSE